MTTTPAPLQPVEVADVLQSLDDFQRAFVLSGRRCEIRRSGILIFPLVGAIEYDVLIGSCECPVLEVHYLTDPDRHVGQFYSVCAAHQLQYLGRATRSRPARSERTERRRKSGATTSAWYRSRGM